MPTRIKNKIKFKDRIKITGSPYNIYCQHHNLIDKLATVIKIGNYYDICTVKLDNDKLYVLNIDEFIVISEKPKCRRVNNVSR
jgi:hypothetical protein